MSRRRWDSAVERFSLAQRVEHFLLLISFNVLVITGLPQKYSGEGWGERLIVLFGGIDQTRFIHRSFAVLLVALGIYHLLAVAATRKRPVRRHDMNLRMRDIRDLFADILFLSGISRERPRFGRFDYRQKFEYLAVLWGTVIMAVTGLVMWFPSLVTQWLPGVVVPAARVAHGGEALLAMLSVVLWHFYNAHFRPDVFPMDPAMFTGKITVERLRHEHAEEFDELRELGALPAGHSPEDAVTPSAST